MYVPVIYIFKTILNVARIYWCSIPFQSCSKYRSPFGFSICKANYLDTATFTFHYKIHFPVHDKNSKDICF